MPRHFLTLKDLSRPELLALLEDAIALKAGAARGQTDDSLSGKVLAMIFEKSSTRTRVAFETAMAQLGGHALFLSAADSQLGRGEPVEDTARVLAKMVDVVMIRTFSHDTLQAYAACSDIPVINGLSDGYHPCQLLADIQTYMEHRGDIKGKKVAWFGDGNNVCHSWINAADLLQFELVIAGPAAYQPDPAIVAAGNGVSLSEDPVAAATGADLLVTDVWTSMGQEDEAAARQAAFAPFQVNAALLQHAAADALFMHCLPAHRDEEVTAEVLEGPQSVVWDEAGNRLHAQKALLRFLLGQG
ncbi:MAG: ornithine carbamoyltransferase [Gammaproteobacteria bacterium]